MKKLLLTMLGVVGMLCSTSCSDEEIVSGVEGETMVQFTVELTDGSDASRAISDGLSVDDLYCEVYSIVNNTPRYLAHLDKDAVEMTEGTNAKGETVMTAKVDFALVKGQSYKVVFWAQDENGAYTIAENENGKLTNITLNPTTANNEANDAFTAVKELTVTGPISETITLTRPFAQINFGTLDVEAAKNAGITFSESRIIVSNAVSSYNALMEEAASEGAELTFEWASNVENIANETLEVGGTPYKYLATAYMLVPGDKTQKLSDLKMEIRTGLNEIITLNVPNAPVQRNFRTNILGNLLTNQAEFTVEVSPIYDGDKETIEIWDGKTLAKPDYDEPTKTYSVDSPEELAWIANLVNGTLPAEARSEVAAAENLKGQIIKLTGDINLANQAWTPIGNSKNKFVGTFDGNGHTIYNLTLAMEGKSDVGLFGFTTDGEIKNLTIENANVKGRLNVGVVAGTPYTSKYTNITVKGHVEVNGMAYVGAVGGKNAYADWTDVTVAVDEESYVKANSVENGTAYRTYVGGVCGFNGEGGHTFKNIKSNIDVIGSTCDAGGLFGIAHYGNKFENCVCTGDVEIYNASEAADAQEIGGIAGVWNNGGEQVTLTNCKFEGELRTNIEVDFYYGGLVGKPYSETGAGVLVIDGTEFNKDGVKFEQINGLIATGYVFPFDLTGKATASNGYGGTGLTQLNGGVLDGAGYTLKVKAAGGTWDSAINTTGGTIKNLTVAEGFRGIFVNHNSSHSEKVILENVTINGPVYTVSCDQGTNQGLEAYKSTFNGWTSYAATIGNVRFTECSFGKGAGYAFCRPYAPTQFINCNFSEGFKVDPRDKVTFVNCTLNGVALTADNLATLVSSNIENASFGEVETTEALNAAVAEKNAVVVVKAGEYTFPSSNVAEGVIIKCEEGTVFTGNTKLNIKGATVEGATFSNPSGTAVDQTINGTFKNCTFTGSNALRWCYAGETTVFEDCVFDGAVYGVHFDGGSNPVTFRRCTLSGFNAFAGVIELLTFEDCTFKANGKSSYNGANLWGSAKLINTKFEFDGKASTEWIDCISADKSYELRNCKVNGVDYTPENYTEYLDIMFSRNHATVKVNGVDCQF